MTIGDRSTPVFSTPETPRLYNGPMVTQVSALERVLRLEDGDLPAELAAYLVKLEFPPADHARYQQLSDKAQEGTLTEKEKAELDDLLTANDVLMILQSKARASLKRHSPAA